MAKLIASTALLFGAAVWFVLFVIIGTGLGTAFIAAGIVAAAGLIAAGMVAAGPMLDAPLSATGLLLGVAAFAAMQVVLSIPVWVDVVSGLGVIGLYGIVDAALRGRKISRGPGLSLGSRLTPSARARSRNGHQREPVGAR